MVIENHSGKPIYWQFFLHLHLHLKSRLQFLGILLELLKLLVFLPLLMTLIGIFLRQELLLWLSLGLMILLAFVLEVLEELLKPQKQREMKMLNATIKTSLLAHILPEEYRADLNTLRHRLIVKQKLPKWVANIRICLFLLAVFKGWLQIKFEDIFLPQNRSS